ncbi:hypothetical protein A28LD_0210 [Idiomarina sp. A28L]|uniref:hypothetical protein n=1 Tax=Idiomarina sp. A28L TaxID=1036674 RepID=UPI000213884B|nr:hypothetical protein [Idiomarina sp. A28L]EGN76467.1 hypothetical protein A28LD_0210 [Idiomarina sp. A28L]
MEKKPHSGLGLGSFYTSIVSGIILIILIVSAGYLEASSPGGMDEESSAAIVIGLLMLLSLAASLIALGLGISGLFQKEKKKIFAILGSLISALIIVGTISLIAFGLSMG